MTDIVIGIDPDVTKDGVAILNTTKRTIEIYNTTFGATLDKIESEFERANIQGKTLKVFVEAGWLNKSNFHLPRPDASRIHNYKQLCAAIGKAQGENHQRGKDIFEWCSYNHIPCAEQAPLKKYWKGKDGKITQEEINNLLPKFGVEPIKRANQEVRDAVLIAVMCSNIPQINPYKITKK